MKTLIIARFTLAELRRKKLLLFVFIMSAVFVIVYAAGMHYFNEETTKNARHGQNAVLQIQILRTVMALMGLYVVNYLAGLLAVFTSIGTISGEIDSGTLHAVVPKPIRRLDIVLGKWLAYAALLSVYTTVMVAAVLLVAREVVGFTPPNALFGGSLIVLQVLLLLSVSILGSTVLSTLANGVLVFLLYGVAWMGGVIYAIGQSVPSDVMVTIGTVVNYVMPSDFLWKAASYYLQPEFIAAAGKLGANPFFAWSAPDTRTIFYSGAYLIVAVIAANVIFSRRDL